VNIILGSCNLARAVALHGGARYTDVAMQRSKRHDSKVNAIRNADFSLGRDSPRHWTWKGHGRTIRWLREESADRASAGVRIVSDDPHTGGMWSQVVACKPGEFYRVEAAARGDLAASAAGDGVVLRVQPLRKGRARGAMRTTLGLCGEFASTVIRTYFQAPSQSQTAEVSVGLVGSKGTVTIGTVRFVPILEPDEMSHPLAVPPPAWAQRQPQAAQSVAVCCDSADDRPLTKLLRLALGQKRVVALSPGSLDPARPHADVVLLPDPVPPEVIRSLEALCKLSSERIVVISLPAFARLSRGQTALRRIEQADDPIHAKVVLSNFATAGFALHDVFAYAGPGRTPGSFAQNQFRKTAKLAAFCKRHGFETLLVSVCEKDATSEQPICLYRPTGKGALFVLDLEPLEADVSTMGERALAMHLLLSILGHSRSGLGQYTVPVRTDTDFRALIREFGLRFEDVFVDEPDAPNEETHQQLVTLGGEDRSFGLPLRPSPMILVRTGLVSGDVEAVYGAWTWFKQLLRPAPFRCPYGDRLASQFRLAWVPSVAPWASGGRWKREGGEVIPMELELDDARVAAVIDIVSHPEDRLRVSFAKRDEATDRMRRWLPRLFEAFGPAHHFLPAAKPGAYLGDRSRFDWRPAAQEPEVTVDAAGFDEGFHQQALAAGGNALRLEVPGFDADSMAHSIARTDLVATLLEQVMGMQFGLIAVNRGRAPVRIDGFAPVGVGEALIVERSDLSRYAADAG